MQERMNRKIRITYYGTYRKGPEYSRTENTLLALEQAGYRVSECNYNLWKTRNSRRAAAMGGWLKLLLSNCWAQLVLFLKYISHGRESDIIFVGTACYLDVIPAYILSKLCSSELIFDSFYSLYDTIIMDRKLYDANGIIAKFIWQYEKYIYKLPDLIFVDTSENAEYLREEYDVKQRVEAFPPGVPSLFLENLSSSKERRQGSENSYICVFYGSFVPLQGADVIVRAAKLLENHRSIVFRMIGDGQEKVKCMDIAGPTAANIEFLPWMSVEELALQVEEADVCLGIFGDTGKAERVVPYKVYSYMAAGKPIITQKSPAIQAVLNNGESVLVTERHSAESLAESILCLSGNPALAERLGRGSYCAYLETSTTDSIASMLMNSINRLMALPDRKRNEN